MICAHELLLQGREHEEPSPSTIPGSCLVGRADASELGVVVVLRDFP